LIWVIEEIETKSNNDNERMRTCIALLFINLGYRRNRNRVKEWM